MHHNLSYDYGRAWNSNFFVEASGTANIKIYNNTFVNPSTVDGDMVSWYETTNANVDFRNNIVVSYQVLLVLVSNFNDAKNADDYYLFRL